MALNRPSATEYAPYFEHYLEFVPESDVLAALKEQPDDVRKLLEPLSDQQAAFRYAPEKWSVRQVLGHLIDSERIFGYRALCFARGEDKPLPGFDENKFAANSGHDQCSMKNLLDEFELTRHSNVVMFQQFPNEVSERGGIANNNKASVRTIAYVLVGHTRHHLEVLKTRYGVKEV